MISHDFRQGLLKRLSWLLLPMGLVAAIIMTSKGTFLLIQSETGQQPSLGAYLFHMFSGRLPADETGRNFAPDLKWMLIQIGCLVFTVEYPSRDLEDCYGIQILIRGGRCRWWLSKCLWNLVCVFLYYTALYLAAVGYCLCTGKSCALALCEDTIVYLLEDMSMMQQEFSGTELAPILLGVPALTMAAISMWQMTIAVLWHPIYGFAMSIVMLVWSSFSQTPFAIGNYAMMQRCEWFYREGLSFENGFWILIIYILSAVLVGKIVIVRRNILRPLAVGN